jgi:hypothetical protein
MKTHKLDNLKEEFVPGVKHLLYFGKVHGVSCHDPRTGSGNESVKGDNIHAVHLEETQ